MNGLGETLRVGFGFDVHRFAAGRPLILGGVRLEHDQGLDGHSDADVLAHAVIDALLGAAGLGDIGQHFRDDDPRWKGADSRRFVQAVIEMLDARGLRIGNADVTVIAQAPKLAPYRDQMRSELARLLGLDGDRVNIKATTTERLGFLGRAEGIAAQAVVLLVEL